MVGARSEESASGHVQASSLHPQTQARRSCQFFVLRESARAPRARGRAPPFADDSAPFHAARFGTAVAFTALGTLLMDPQRLRPSASVKASISADGLVLLDVDGGLVLAANDIGARIWQLIEQDRTAAEIARRLADDYAVPLDRAQHDVTAFVAALRARGLVAGDPR
jgi:coenzyme PQQ synthesis protein D (PqqD)